jgi:hypothetical protein
LERLSKNAVSYSSASMTKKRRLGQARRHAEVQRHAADQEAGFRPASSRIQASIEVVVVLPCVPATASTQRPAQHVLGQPLRPGHVGQAAVEDRLHQRIAARHRVADHEQVGLERRAGGVVALDELDALRAQLVLIGG